MAEMLGQTITVVNKSGKIVSTSKHLANVWKEAQSAYRERKAEIKASKKGVTFDKLEEATKLESASRESSRERKQSRSKELSKSSRSQKTSKDHEDRTRRRPPPSEPSDRPRHRRRSSSLDDDYRRDDLRGSSHRTDRHLRRSSTDQSGRSKGHRHTGSGASSRSSIQRVNSDGFYGRDFANAPSQSSRLRNEHKPDDLDRSGELVRRRSYPDDGSLEASRSQFENMTVEDDIDMNLAYGELPPDMPMRPQDEEKVLREKVFTLNRLLEEANCLQYSAKAIAKNLEDNPETMAAVALTLAEISNLATKLGPTALTSLKTAFPTVIALLLSSEFLIAAGVGVGITIVMFGGYKIIKRIKNKNEPEKETEEQELVEINSSMQQIEGWRRGIPDVDAQSVGTSVEGEFITPRALKQLQMEGMLVPANNDSPKRTKSSKRDKSPSNIEDSSLSKEDKKKMKKEKEEAEKQAKREKEDEEKRLKREKEDEKLRKRRDKEDGNAGIFSAIKKQIKQDAST